MLYCMQTAQQALKPSRMALEDMGQPLQAAFLSPGPMLLTLQSGMLPPYCPSN